MSAGRGRAQVTSIAVYKDIVASSFVSKQQREALKALFDHGPMTGAEIDKLLGRGKADPSYSRRLSELEDRGVIRRTKQRPCKITGRTSFEWEVTGQLPIKKLPKLVFIYRPDNDVLAVAAYHLKRAARHLRDTAKATELQLAADWLSDGARCPKGH